jgi:hypothetical protein
MVRSLLALPGLFPSRLADDPAWISGLASILRTMLEHGMVQAVRAEAVL